MADILLWEFFTRNGHVANLPEKDSNQPDFHFIFGHSRQPPTQAPVTWSD